MATDTDAVSGDLVDETARFDLKEVCDICGVHADYLVELVEAGIIQAEGDRPTIWRFSSIAIMRSRKALRLRRDLDINLPGLAVTLDLLDQVDQLQHELKSLRQRLAKLEE
mgnify:CR=1 FL=1